MPAYTAKSLAAHWSCSVRQIYDLIEEGELTAFGIGKRGLRITEEEVRRWEGRDARTNRIELENTPSDGVVTSPLPISAIRSLVAVKGSGLAS